MGKYDALFDEAPAAPKRGKYDALFDEPAKKTHRPAGTLEDPITDVRQLYERYPDNAEASRLFNNPANQAKDVAEGQREAYQSQPFNDRANAGFGRFAYSLVPGKKAGGEREAFDQASAGDLPTLAGRLAPEIAATTAGGALLSALTRAGTIAAPAYRSIAQGAAYGAPSVGLHQLQNVTEGRGLDPKGAAVEAVASMAVPFAGNRIAAGMTGAGKEIAKTALKSNTKIAGEKILSDAQADTFLKKFGSLKGLSGSEAKVAELHQALNDKYDDLINNFAAGKIVNVDDAIKTAEANVDALVQKAGINLDDVPTIKSQLNNFRQQIQTFADPQGRAAFPLAQGFKKNTLDEIAQYAKKSPGVFNPELTAKAQAARATRSALAEQMAAVEPKLGPLNRQFQEMAGVEPFIDAAITRGQANRAFSMQDLMTLGGGVAGGGALLAGTDIDPKYSLAALIPFLISRGQKSPTLATALHRGGSSLGNPSNLRDVVMQGLRSGGNEAFGSSARERRRQASVERAAAGQINLDSLGGPFAESGAPGIDTTLQDGIRRGLLQLGPIMSGN